MIIPRRHQKEFCEFATTRSRSFAWHEVGTGKTLSALNSARVMIAKLKRLGVAAPKVLVIAPAYLANTWRTEATANASDLVHNIILTSFSQLHNIDGLLKYYDIRIVIIDESHYLKTMGTQRLRYFCALLEKLKASKGGFANGHIMCLTATPIPNHAGEIYTTWALCSTSCLDKNIERLNDKKAFARWVASFTERKLKKIPKNKNTKAKMGFSAPIGLVNEDQMHELISPFTHFVAAADCLDLPPLREATVDLGIPDDTLLKNADIDKPSEYMALVERLNRAKTPHAISWIKDFMLANPSKHLIVFSPFKEALKSIQEKFPTKCSMITGDVSSSQRTANIQKFRDMQTPILLVTFGAGSLGLNLQFAHNSFYIGYPWSPKIITQAMGRTNRSGQHNSTMHTFLLSGANDRRVLSALRRKEEGIDKLEESIRMSRPEIINVEKLVNSLI